MTHYLFETADKKAPDGIKDRNGEVVLGLCKLCGKAEVELDQPCVGFVNGEYFVDGDKFHVVFRPGDGHYGNADVIVASCTTGEGALERATMICNALQTQADFEIQMDRLTQENAKLREALGTCKQTSDGKHAWMMMVVSVDGQVLRGHGASTGAAGCFCQHCLVPRSPYHEDSTHEVFEPLP